MFSKRTTIKPGLKKSILSLVLAIGLAGPAAWSTVSHACSSEPFLGSICIMAWPKTVNFGTIYVAAAGQTMTIAQNQALYAVLGSTYGGDGRTNFLLPDLRGRVIVGVGSAPDYPHTYNFGEKGGNSTTTLTLTQLPTHNHLLSGVTVTTGIGSLAANTTNGSLAANTTIGTLAANTILTGLTATLNAASGGTKTATANGAALFSVSPSGPPTLYTSTTPNIAMNSASISISGNPGTTLTGSPSTTLTGTPMTTLSGAPAVTVSGNTNQVGSGQAFLNMQPYLAMSYYIAANNSLFPTPD